MFTVGFEKTAKINTNGLPAGVAAGAALGALVGHAAHVQKKLMHARQGKDYKEKTFIDKHPYLTGAATFGLAPAVSTQLKQRELDRDNAKVRSVMKAHPLMTSEM